MDKNSYKYGYYKMYSSFVREFGGMDISPSAKLVYMFGMAPKILNNSSICYVSYSDIQTDTNISSRRTVSASIKELEENNLIERYGNGFYKLKLGFFKGLEEQENKDVKNIEISSIEGKTYDLQRAKNAQNFQDEGAKNAQKFPNTSFIDNMKENNNMENNVVAPINNLTFSNNSPFMDIGWLQWKKFIEKYGIGRVNSVIALLEDRYPRRADIEKEPICLVQAALKNSWDVGAELNKEIMRREARNKAVKEFERQQDLAAFERVPQIATRDEDLHEKTLNLLQSDFPTLDPKSLEFKIKFKYMFQQAQNKEELQ